MEEEPLPKSQEDDSVSKTTAVMYVALLFLGLVVWAIYSKCWRNSGSKIQGMAMSPGISECPTDRVYFTIVPNSGQKSTEITSEVDLEIVEIPGLISPSDNPISAKNYAE